MQLNTQYKGFIFNFPSCTISTSHGLNKHKRRYPLSALDTSSWCKPLYQLVGHAPWQGCQELVNACIYLEPDIYKLQSWFIKAYKGPFKRKHKHSYDYRISPFGWHTSCIMVWQPCPCPDNWLELWRSKNAEA